jgi:hypothetical protein
MKPLDQTKRNLNHLEVSSTYPKLEQLKCVLCYFVVAFVGLKKGIINYKSINEISTFQKHLEMIH